MSKRSSRSKRKDLRIIYPEYFDKNLSWKMGRRVPQALAFEEPEIQRVALAAKRLGYEVYLDSKKHYPKTWYESRGRVLISKVGSKEEQLREIAKMMKKVPVPKTPAQKRKELEKKKKVEKKAKKGSVYRQKKR